MTMRVALVASTTADVTGDMLAARLGHLLANGWDARLLCNGARWRQDPALHEPGLRRHVTLDPDGGPRSSPFDRLLRRLRPDLVHFHSGWAAWKAMHRGQLPDTRVVISFRDDGQDLRVPDPRFLWKRSDLLLFGHRAALERAAAQAGRLIAPRSCIHLCRQSPSKTRPHRTRGYCESSAPGRDLGARVRALRPGSAAPAGCRGPLLIPDHRRRRPRRRGRLRPPPARPGR